MFNPLHMLRQLREDDQLTGSQFGILCAAVLRTDNRTGRVRASQQMLAEDAKTTERTVRTFYRSKAFERYFETEWSGRRLELTWLTPEAIPEVTPETASALLPTTSTTRPMRENYLTGEEFLLAEELWFNQEH